MLSLHSKWIMNLQATSCNSIISYRESKGSIERRLFCETTNAINQVSSLHFVKAGNYKKLGLLNFQTTHRMKDHTIKVLTSLHVDLGLFWGDFGKASQARDSIVKWEHGVTYLLKLMIGKTLSAVGNHEKNMIDSYQFEEFILHRKIFQFHLQTKKREAADSFDASNWLTG